VMIQRLEELAMNAWPALQTVLDDGWVLRFAGGYTKRANSIHPLYPSSLAVDGKVEACEAIYRSRGLPAVFKLTPASRPESLDATLAARGYRLDSPTSVQTLDLNGWHRAPVHLPSITEAFSEEWLAAACRLGNIAEHHRPAMRQMLQSIVPARCFASICLDEVIASGIGVEQNGFVGLFDIVTDARFRRQGYGRALVEGIIGWGQRLGAHTAYLQVVANNEPARRLYSNLGFTEIYRYWYRIAAG
jgi:N-acetylglutamate synthase